MSLAAGRPVGRTLWVGGAGAIAVAQLAEAGHVPAGVKILGVDEDFGQSAYTAGELYAKHGMDSAAIVAAGKALAS